MQTLATDLDITLPQLSIAWCISNPNVTTAILGATKKEQLAGNLLAIDALPKLTPEVRETIETIMNNKPVLPDF